MKKLLFILPVFLCLLSSGQLVTKTGAEVDTLALGSGRFAAKVDTASALYFTLTSLRDKDGLRYDSVNHTWKNIGVTWLRTGNDVYNGNIGNVGIGTTAPNSGAQLSINATGGGTLWVTNENGNSNMSTGATTGNMEFAGYFGSTLNDLSRIRGLYLGDGNSRLGALSFWTRTYTGNREGMRLTPQSNLLIGGTAEDSSAKVNISSLISGILIPRMTTTQMNAIVLPTASLLLYNTTDSAYYYKRISGWTKIKSGNETVISGGTGLTSMTAYTLLAGGTTSTGNLQQVSGTGISGQALISNGPSALPTWQTVSAATTIIDSPQHTYAPTPTFTAGTAPTGATNNTYQWTQVGKMVNLRVNLLYATAGATVTVAFIPLPSDCPAPLVPTGYTTNEYLYMVNGNAGAASPYTPGGAARAGLYNSATPEMRLVLTSGAWKSFEATVTYWTN